MSYDEDDGMGYGFKMDLDEDEPLEEPLEKMPDTDFGLDEEDPDRDG